jgi:hypothetical protein
MTDAEVGRIVRVFRSCLSTEKVFSGVSDEKLMQLITTTPVLPEPEPPMPLRDAVYGHQLNRTRIEQGVERIRASWGIDR